MDSSLSPETQSTPSVKNEQDVPQDCPKLAKSDGNTKPPTSEKPLRARLQADLNDSDIGPSQTMISESDSHNDHQSTSPSSENSIKYSQLSSDAVPQASGRSDPDTHFLPYSEPQFPPPFKGQKMYDRDPVLLDIHDLASRVPGDLLKYMFPNVPRDNRIRLIYDMVGLWVDQTIPTRNPIGFIDYDDCIWSIKWAQSTAERRLIEPFGPFGSPWCMCDMHIIDHVKTGKSQSAQQRVYQMREEPSSSAAGYEKSEEDFPCIERPECQNALAPWRRIIFYSGLSMSLERDFPDRQERARQGPRDPGLATIGLSPDLVYGREPMASAVTWTAINEAVELHLDCSPRKGGDRINPYLDASRSFHITFYEIVSEAFVSDILFGPIFVAEKISDQEIWKKGHLYSDPGSSHKTKAPIFRRSAFTILVVTENLTSTEKKACCPDLSPEWGTMLVLCPSFTSRWGELSLNEKISNKLITSKWKAILEYNKVRVGEIAIIKEEYGILPQRWSALLDHITSLLQEDFMDPESYTKLIFDDDQLSTSKKYFWILACIQEFRTHILDNIKQWNLFRQARLDPFSGTWPNELTELVKQIEQSCSALDGIRSDMDDIVETVKARRDGLFNASALSESRNSNRLGQNVKLLTYVSIFYLPLAFCAALWAIPNISLGDTRTAFIVTSVVLGLVNFLVVANLNNISQNLANTYNIWRSRVVQDMKHDHHGRWHQEGQRLDKSWPEQPKAPSEWLILRYQIVRLLRIIIPLKYRELMKDTWRYYKGDGMPMQNDNFSASNRDP